MLITLALGLYAGRGIKNIKEYALGTGRFSTFSLTLTFLATYIGGGTIIGNASEVYSAGVIVFIATLAVPIQNLLFSFFLGPKILRFKNCITIGDIMQRSYGEKAKILTGILTFIFSIFIIIIQFILLGNVIGSILEIRSEYIIIMTGSILATYSIIGGIRAVILTDIIQFIILIVALPIIISLALKLIGGYKNLFINLPSEKFHIFNNKNFIFYLVGFLNLIIPQWLLWPSLMQRIFIIKNPKQIQNKFIFLSIMDLFIRLLILIIGLSAVILYPDINSKNVVSHMITNLIKSPILKGIVTSGIIAIIISTIDSISHSIGIVFSHDILKPILNFKLKTNKELKIARSISFLAIFISVMLSIIDVNNFVYFRNLEFFSVGLIAPILLTPLFFSIIGVKTDKKSFIFGILNGIIFVIISKKLLSPSLTLLSTFIGILANGITYITIHIIQNKGISWVKREEDSEKTKLWVPSLEKIFDSITNAIPTPKKIYNFCRHQVAKYGSPHILLVFMPA